MNFDHAQAKLRDSYNTIDYPAQSYRESSIERLEIFARLCGLKPAPSQSAKLLELGCGSGMNLIPMAFRLPDSQFVGIDFSELNIKRAQRIAQELHLKNIEFLNADIFQSEIPRNCDYIVAHGLLTWIPKHKHEHLLEKISTSLSKNGIAYISYNCLPGWTIKTSIREYVLNEFGKLPSNPQELQDNLQELDQWIKSMALVDQAGASSLAQAVTEIKNKAPGFSLHDEFELESSPLYFKELMGLLETHSLFYVGDSLQDGNLLETYPELVREHLKRTHLENRQQLESKSDFIRNRKFRRSIVSKGKPSDPKLLWSEELFVYSKLKVLPDHQYEHPTYGKVRLHFPEIQEPLLKLQEARPQAIALKELLPTDQASDQEKLLDRLLFLFRMDLIEFWPYALCAEKFEKPKNPKAFLLNQIQAKHQMWLTNELHESISLDERACELVGYLDGSKDLQELARQMQLPSPEHLHSSLEALSQFSLLKRSQ